MKKKENKKKKEEDYSKYFYDPKKPRDLTIESFKKPEEPYVIYNYRLKAQVIDSPTQYRMTKPKMVDPVMNMLCYMMTGKSLDELEKDG